MKDTTISTFAYAAAGFFIATMVIAIGIGLPEFEGTPPLSVNLFTLFGLIFHLAMLPVIAALPAPLWAKVSGFTWVVVDNMLILLSFYSAREEIVTPLRMGVHLATATWIFGASMSHTGALRWVGFIVVIAMAGVSLIGPFLGNAVVQASGPGALLLIIWIFMVGNHLGRSNAVAQ
ncbi:MAG TPA: hypothetical protein VFQ23_07870 [Anaerolineales bacterium]|nr:hypothetical protein [Anaerolineales bacterium]